MTDLTEQWKKGELDIDECYFAETEGGIYKATGEYLNNSSCINGFDITSILEPVPSYDEWIGVKQQRDLENKLRHDSDNRNWQLRTENTKLKELLKECELWFTGIVGNMNDKNFGEHNRSVPIGKFEYAFKEFSQKINEVIK